MSTWNVVLGSDSTTTPSTSIISDFAKSLSLLVLITAAECGKGFTKLTIGDFFAASDLLGHRAVALPAKLRMLPSLSLGVLHPAPFSVSQQEEVSLRRKHEEEISLVPAGRGSYDI